MLQHKEKETLKMELPISIETQRLDQKSWELILPSVSRIAVQIKKQSRLIQLIFDRMYRIFWFLIPTAGTELLSESVWRRM